MAQKIFKNIYVMFTLVVMSIVVASCDKSEDEFLLNTYNNGGNNNSEITINVKRDAENGIIEASREVNHSSFKTFHRLFSVRIQPLRLLLVVLISTSLRLTPLRWLPQK